MDGLKVVWTQTALKQRSSIFDYWNKRNKSKTYSQKLNLAIRERLELLKKQPEIGKATAVKKVQSISMRHYSIFYTIEKKLDFYNLFLR